MSRSNIIQVSCTEGEKAMAERAAEARGIPLAQWARGRIFGYQNIVARAAFFSSLDAITNEAADKLVNADGFTHLLFFWFSGVDSGDVVEVADGLGVPTETHLLGSEARIVIAGSPWPFEVLHQFTSSSRSTALLVRGVKDEWVPYTLGDGSIAGQAKSKVS